MFRIRHLIMFVIFWGSASTLFAQQEAVSLRMEVDKRQVDVGDSITLTLEFRQIATGNASIMGEPQIPTPEHFEIRGQRSFTQVSMVNQQTMSTTTNKLELAATKAGTETLGPALMIYQDVNGKKKEVKSNVVSVSIVEKTGFSLFGRKSQAKAPEPKPETNQNPAAAQPPPGDQLRGIKPLLPETYMLFKLLFWLTLLCALGWFLWRLLRKPPQGKVVPQVPKPAQLKDAWKKLGNEELSGKEFCAGLSRLVCECLEYRYGFPAVNYTTDQILNILPEHKLSADEAAAVEKCLRTCDRVLYADANLTGRDNLRSLCSGLLPKVQKN